jgi:predicted nucleotidyltransferase
MILLMVDPASILRFVDSVVEKFHPDRVILFGSYAYGEPTNDSDVDLLLVMPYRGVWHAVATKVRLAVPRDFPMDLMVRSEAEMRRQIKQGDIVLNEIATKGIILHEASDARVGRQGRSRLRRRFAAAAVA